MKTIRYYIFLRDVLLLSLTAFGGPQVHLALFHNTLVKKRKYITEEELIDLNSFCQLLPGPSSTQTLTAVGFKIGGPNLAFLTLLVWMLPAVSIMTLAGLFISYSEARSISLEFTRFIQPMAVAFVLFSAYKIGSTAIQSKISIAVFLLSAIACYYVRSPAIFPIVLILGGFSTSFGYNKQAIEEKPPLKVEWSNLILCISVGIGAALIGRLTHALPIRLFENFYRNGSIVFGGGQILSALMYKEFVEFKHYLSSEEFLSGLALLQILPGPLFSFSAYVGSLAMRQYGIGGQLLGSLVSTIGIFLPGTLMIFFIIRFWDRLKKYRIVRASLEGINAASAGIVTATAIILFQPLATSVSNYLLVLGTFGILFTRIPHPFIIIAGLLAGIIF